MHYKLTVRSPDEDEDEILELDTDFITYQRIKRTYHDAGYAIKREEFKVHIPPWSWLVVAVMSALVGLVAIAYLLKLVMSI